MSFYFDNMLLVFFSFFRATGLILVTPFLGGKNIPMLLKVSLGFFLSFFSVCNLDYSIPLDGVFQVLVFAFGEILVGLLMGFSIAFIFSAADFAGSIISSESSLIASSAFDLNEKKNFTLIGKLYFYLIVVLIFVSGSHLKILYSYFQSFSIVPVGALLYEAVDIRYFLNLFSRIFILGLQVAIPIISINFLVNFSFSFLGKAVPKMNVFVSSFGVRILGAFAMLYFTVSLTINYFLSDITFISKRMLSLFGG